MTLKVAVALFAAVASFGARASPTQTPASPAAATVDAKTAAPQIQFLEPVFDAGTLTAGAVVRHEYAFTNTGGAPLQVTRVEPSCGCTTIETWTARLAPGQTGTIPIYFDSADLSGDISRWIVVASTDPDRPEVALTVKAIVRAPIDVSPAQAIFTPGAGTRTSETKIIRITNRTAEPLILAAPQSSNRAFAVELKTVVPGQEFELHVTAVPPFASHSRRGTITIKTNSSQRPRITVDAVAIIRPPHK